MSRKLIWPGERNEVDSEISPALKCCRQCSVVSSGLSCRVEFGGHRMDTRMSRTVECHLRCSEL